MLFEIGLLVVTHLVIPAIMLIWLWRSKSPSKLNLLIILSTVAAYSVQIFMIGRWDWFSYYLRYLLPILFLVAAVHSFTKAKSLPLYPPKRFRNYLDLGTSALVTILSGSITSQVGSLVRSGDAIGKVGNSGNTGEPHLHIHTRKANTGKSSLDGEGVPISFDGKFLVRNSVLFENESI